MRKGDLFERCVIEPQSCVNRIVAIFARSKRIYNRAADQVCTSSGHTLTYSTMPTHIWVNSQRRPNRQMLARSSVSQLKACIHRQIHGNNPVAGFAHSVIEGSGRRAPTCILPDAMANGPCSVLDRALDTLG